jgi:CxxC motif-containing protein (DUF1111 family)
VYPVSVGARLVFALVLVAACGDNDRAEDVQGGTTTVDDRTAGAFLHPAANLTQDERAEFQAGTGPFAFHWEIPLLGPLYNNDSCFGCHGSNGRGRSQIGADGATTDINGPQSEALVRVSLPSGTPDSPGGPVAVPGYGLQLQDHATVGLPEVFVTLSWQEMPGTYGDGTPFSLRAPQLSIVSNDGPIPADALYSYRIAPPLIGLGLLEAIDEATIDALADPDDLDHDGISGHPNHVWDAEAQVTALGRFGWKANAPDLHVQAAGAAANDMGLSSYVFPDPNNERDVQDAQLDNIAFMVSTIAVPRAAPRDAAASHGRALFDQLTCSSCHVPTLETGTHPIAELAHQTIHPYTDLLLHDMGEGLADHRPDFEATGSEWRTPALWGIGLAQVIRDTTTFLHDGRARTLEEAILWHDGEALTAREAFRTASQADRDALIAFLNTL